MRYHLILLFSSIIMCCRQDQDASKDFLRTFLGKTNGVVYIIGPPKNELETIRKVLARDTIRPNLLFNEHGFSNDALLLNKAERISLNLQLEQLDDEEWYNDVLENAKAIKEDSLAALVRDKSRGWPYFYKHFGNRIYQFSRPILLYDNTISIFFYSYFDENNIDEGELVVYKKENNTWRKWLTLYYPTHSG